MKNLRNNKELYISMGSYAPWGKDERYPKAVFDCLARTGLTPDRFDEVEPVRRVFKGNKEDWKFWMALGERKSTRWLFIKRTKRPNPYLIVINWVDFENQLINSRGDYHSLYGSFITTDVPLIVNCWRSLCADLNPFHALADEYQRYNHRAHLILPDGTVQRTVGGYLQQLPGFFAHNYFSGAYKDLLNHDQANRTFREFCQLEKNGGVFIDSPAGMFHIEDTEHVYTKEEYLLIRILGEEYFHLPGSFPSLNRAPTLTALRNS